MESEDDANEDPNEDVGRFSYQNEELTEPISLFKWKTIKQEDLHFHKLRLKLSLDKLDWL